ncbi:MAG: AraC family transcriptional regulator [Gammaproteobacteria bacterium]|nr:AraC family transcriptional regulator [Gammaproteobacteria bacterium]
MYPTNTSSYGSTVVSIFQAIESYGLDGHAILSDAGLDLHQVSQPLYRVPGEAMAHLVTTAEAVTGDPCFSFRVASYIHPTTYGALGFALYSSNNVRAFCHRLSRFHSFITTNHDCIFDEADKEPKLLIKPADTDIDRLVYRSLVSGYMAVMVHFLREISSPDFHPVRVEIACESPPGCEQVYRDYFKSEVAFSTGEYALVFDPDEIDRPFPAANVELARQNDQIVMKMLADTVKGDLVMQVRSKLVELLPSGECSKEDIARELYMSVRTLHNKLERLGSSYQQVLDDTRRELAEQYMQQQQRSISEVAYSLGFSDCSNFSRAFKRWTGESPSRFRSRKIAGSFASGGM